MRRLAVAILFMGTVGAFQAEPPSPAEGFLITSVGRTFVVKGNNGEILRVSETGDVTFGKGVKPSDAAKEFARMLRVYGVCDGK